MYYSLLINYISIIKNSHTVGRDDDNRFTTDATDLCFLVRFVVPASSLYHTWFLNFRYVTFSALRHYKVVPVQFVFAPFDFSQYLNTFFISEFDLLFLYRLFIYLIDVSYHLMAR